MSVCCFIKVSASAAVMASATVAAEPAGTFGGSVLLLVTSAVTCRAWVSSAADCNDTGGPVPCISNWPLFVGRRRGKARIGWGSRSYGVQAITSCHDHNSHLRSFFILSSFRLPITPFASLSCLSCFYQRVISPRSPVSNQIRPSCLSHASANQVSGSQPRAPRSLAHNHGFRQGGPDLAWPHRRTWPHCACRRADCGGWPAGSPLGVTAAR